MLLTPAELAFLFNENEQSVRQQLRDGAVPGAKKIGKLWFVERDTLQRYFEGENIPPRISQADAERIAACVARELVKAGMGACSSRG